MLPINLLAVFVSAVVAFVLGFLFHGPLFGRLWMRLANIHPTGNEKMSDMYGKMFWNLVTNLITAYILAVIYLLASTSPYISSSALVAGITVGLLTWLGFIATSTSIEVIWMGRKFKLWLFEACCSFVVMAIMGAIIALWQ